jgi:hypothetical protein
MRHHHLMAEASDLVLGAAGDGIVKNNGPFCKFLVSRALYTLRCLLSQLLLHM